ncbi:MAG: hypothetical protein QOH46_72, partial [Solirubrobacteraceae bacterium]|nr:hypothetical protein [Solirubrobacteraceae bacterium]
MAEMTTPADAPTATSACCSP